MGQKSPRGYGLHAVIMRAPARNAPWFAVLALAGCAATPPSEDPVQVKLNDLDARLARIERVVANQSLLQLANEVEALRSDVRAMHNDIDGLGHNLETSRKQQRDLYADLDRRLKSLEPRNAPAAGDAPVASAPRAAASGAASNLPVPDGSDKANYQAAFALLKDSQYDRAIAAFQEFLVSFPDSALADNAQYWLGEAYYVNKSFPEALSAFQRVVDKYPQSRKLPDALLKIGYCDYELKQWQAAKDALSQVASSYPDTPAGHLAQQRLEKMAAEKH
jgi:tol-pal system protein YbgF